jgi:hypothetical protein
MDMTDRTLYTGVKPARSPAPTVQKDKLVEQISGTYGGESRAKIDTVADRLARLGLILAEHDPDKLREWRLSQMEQLERLAEWRESPDTVRGLKKPKKA